MSSKPDSNDPAVRLVGGMLSIGFALWLCWDIPSPYFGPAVVALHLLTMIPKR